MQSIIRSAQPLIEYKGEDIVYSTIERRSGEASQPTTTRCFTVITIILGLKGTQALLESLSIKVMILPPNLFEKGEEIG
ncbi:hypothetical protein GCM10027286_00340 [Virgibacillus ainsalahensis]